MEDFFQILCPSQNVKTLRPPILKFLPTPLQMAVAAAIGVGDGGDQEEGDVMSSRLANATSRLSGKRSLLRSSSGIPSSNSESLGQSQQQRRVQLQQQQGLSEINRSIEKMTLQTMNNGESSSSHR